MIEQQYYTRERGGLFGESDGYDSIAKSKGLKLEFIKKHIHPLCSYDMPGGSKSEDNIKEADCPANFIIAKAPSGEMIVGQAVYKNKDFTGLRPTFFMHNYVAAGSDKEKLINNPQMLFGIKDFVQSYDIGLGKELPSLTKLPYEDSNELLYNRAKLFGILGITEKLFKQMLYAVFAAAVSKKKVYICLDVSPSLLTTYSKALLCHIYQNMPRLIAQDLGVSTYCRTLEAKKGIHILFVEKSVIKHVDSKIDKEFVFDFVSQKFLNADNAVELNKYFSFALKYSGNQLIWEAFNGFITSITKGMILNAGKNLDLHHYLSLIFEMKLYMLEKKRYNFECSNHRNGLLVNLANYIKLDIDEKIKEELKVVMNYAICEFAYQVDKDILLELDEIREIIKFRTAAKAYQDAIDVLTYNLAQAVKLKKDSYIKGALDVILEEKEVYHQLFKRLYSKDDLRRVICYKRLDDCFKEAKVLDKFIQAMDRLESVEELFQEDAYYKELTIRCFNESMQNAADKVQLLKTVQKWCKTKQLNIYTMLLTTCEAYVLEKLKLTDIPEHVLLEIQFSKPCSCFNYKVIETYKELKAGKGSLANLEQNVLEAVQKLIKIHYKRSVKKEEFYMILYAFVYIEGLTDGRQKANVDVKGALNFVAGLGMPLLLDFIIWAKGETQYINPLSYDKQIIQYFLTMKRSKKKVPKDIIKAKLTANTETQKLYQKIKASQQSKFTKFLINNKYGILFSGVALTAVLIVGGIYYRYQVLERETLQLINEGLKEETNEPPLMISPVTPSKLDSEIEKRR